MRIEGDYLYPETVDENSALHRELEEQKAENRSVNELLTAEVKTVSSLSAELEEAKGRIRDLEEGLRSAVYEVGNARKGYCGDHTVYVAQVSEQSLNRWRSALNPKGSQ